MKKTFLPVSFFLAAIPSVALANDFCAGLTAGQAALLLNDGSARIIHTKDGRGEKILELPAEIKGKVVGMCSFTPKTVSTFSNATPSNLLAVAEIGKAQVKLGGSISAITYRDKTSNRNINYWKSGEFAEDSSLYSYFNNHTNKFELFQAKVGGGYYHYFPTNKSSNNDWTYISEVKLEAVDYDGVAKYSSSFPADSGTGNVRLDFNFAPGSVYVSIDNDPSRISHYKIKAINNNGSVVSDTKTNSGWQHYYYPVEIGKESGVIYITSVNYSGDDVGTVALPF